MTATLENISTKIVESYSHSLSENERVNKILDHINDKKKEYVLISKGLYKLSKLLVKITWLDNLNQTDEVIIKGVITMGKEADKHFRRFYINQRKIYAPKGWFKEDFKQLKNEIDFHIETIKDLENIIFTLRKDEEFKSLCNQFDEF